MGQQRNDQRQFDAPPAANEPSTETTIAAGAARPDFEAAVMPVFRVVPRSQADSAFSSDANRSGGRWTSPGVAAVYASTSPAGAVLEFLAHMDGEKPVEIALVSAHVPIRHVIRAADLPPHWREMPYRDDVREYGNRWIESCRSLAIALPSVLCEQSTNLLINPRHAEVAQLTVDNVEPFTLDPRLLEE